ncbi:MAG: HEAT repeat domain-containing protein [Desulfococcaceae bacterium]
MQNQTSSITEPYKGLRPYEAQDRDIFFGRDTERDILIDKILSHKLTLLFAATGVGKSSLLHASVLPKLKESEELDVVYFRDWSGANPLEMLKNSVLALLGEQGKTEAGFEMEDNLRLKDFFHTISAFSSEPLVIMLDQFEEFFYYQRFNKEFQNIVKQIAESVNDRQSPVVFVFSMREDFALELNAFKEELPTTLFQNFYRLEKLSAEKAAKAIEEPVKNFGFAYEDSLLNDLLQDLADREKQSRFGTVSAPLTDSPAYVEPPYLQIVCTQLWEMEKQNPEKKIRLEVYKKKGRAAGFVDAYFQNVMKEFSAEEKRIASRAFDFLITPYGTKMAYPIKYLANLIMVKESELIKILNKLEAFRILRKQSRQEDIWYELYHDIFSKIIHKWNDYFKDSESYHLRLCHDNKMSDMIELYRGRITTLNTMGLINYEIETGYKRNLLEPDKIFIEKQLGEYDTVFIELIGMMPLTQRILEYWKLGEITKSLKLAEVSISESDIVRSQNVIEILAGFYSVKSITILKNYINEASYNIKKMIIKSMEFMPYHLVKDSLNKQLTDVYTEIRTVALDVLGKIGNTDSVVNILPLLKDRSADVRRSAVSALINLGITDAVKDILPLLKDQDVSVRSSAVSALVNLLRRMSLKDKDIVPLLKDQNVSVRSSAVSALGNLGKAESVKDIVPLLTDQDSSVRSSAVSALVKIGSAESVKDIVPLLKDQDASVRSSAVSALINIGITDAVKNILPLLNDEEADVRGSAVSALAELDCMESVKDIFPMLNDQGWYVRSSVVYILGKISNAESVKSIVPLLKDQHWIVRRSAVSALAEFGSMESVKAIVPLYKDHDWSVRSSAVSALVKIGSKDAVKNILPLLKDHDWSVRRSAIWALENLGSKDAVKNILPLLKDENAYVRGSAVGALVNLGSKDAVKNILPLLNDEEADVRGSAVSALAELDCMESVKDIFPMLNDQGWYVRSSVVYILGKISNAESVKSIVPLLKDQHWIVRRSAVSALAEFGSMESVKAIVPLYKDQDANVRGTVAEALEKLGSPESVKGIVPLLKDSSDYVRGSALSALAQLGGIEHVKYIVPLLKDQNAYVGGSAMEVLKKLGSEDSVKIFIPLLKDENVSVRRSAVIAIGKLAPCENMNIIKELYEKEKEDNGVRLAAALVLLMQNDTEGLDFIKEKAKSKEDEDRKRTATILGELPSVQGTALLLEMLADKVPDVRETVVISLGKISSPEILAYLKNTALKEKERMYTRSLAVTGIGNIKTEEAVNTLLEFLKSPEENIQFRAIKALGKNRTAKALPDLLNLLKIQEQRKAQWRKIRDENTDSYTEPQMKNWRTRLEAVSPKTYMECELAYAIAQIDPEKQGIRLLSHDLSAVREGAWMGIGKTRKTELLETLYSIRKQTDKPWERHAAFRAIDYLLIEIEEFGGKADLEFLEKFFPSITEDRLSEGVKTRVEWTIEQMKMREKGKS